MVRPLFDIVQKRVWQILVNTTGTEICCVQTCATGTFVENHQLFTLFKAPERRCQRTNVHSLRCDVQKVVQDAANFGIKNADQRSTTRNFSAGQTFDGQAPSVFLVHRRHVVETVEIRKVLQIGAAFHQLFGATVQQTDMRVAAFNNLTVQFQNQTQHAVSRRVLRAEVDVEVTDLLFARLSVLEAFATIHHAYALARLFCQFNGSGPTFSATQSY